MPDIFDQIHTDTQGSAPVATSAPAGDVFDQIHSEFNAPKSVTTTPPEDKSLLDKVAGGVGPFLSSFASGINPKDVVKGIYQHVLHADPMMLGQPEGKESEAAERNHDLAKKALDAFHSGDYETAAKHASDILLNGLPGVGDVAQKIEGQIGNKDYSGAAGTGLGALALGYLLHKTPAAIEAMGNIGYADPAKDLMKVYKPSDPRFNERVPGAIADIKKNAPVTVTSNEHLASMAPDQIVTPAIQENRAAMDAWHNPVQQAGYRGSVHGILKATSDSIKDFVDPAKRQDLLLETAHKLSQEPLTANRLKSLLEEKNAELAPFYSKDDAVQASAKNAGADSGKSQALLEAQAKALRNEYYNLLDPQGQGAGPREIQRRYGAIKMLQDEASHGPTRNNILAETGGTNAGKMFGTLGDILEMPAAPFRDGGVAGRVRDMRNQWKGTSNPLIERAFKNAPEPTPLPQAPPIQQRYPNAGSIASPAVPNPPPGPRAAPFTPSPAQNTQALLPAATSKIGVNGVIVPDILGSSVRGEGNGGVRMLEAPKEGQLVNPTRVPEERGTGTFIGSNSDRGADGKFVGKTVRDFPYKTDASSSVDRVGAPSDPITKIRTKLAQGKVLTIQELSLLGKSLGR